jgi:hypothetical protein
VVFTLAALPRSWVQDTVGVKGLTTCAKLPAITSRAVSAHWLNRVVKVVCAPSCTPLSVTLPPTGQLICWLPTAWASAWRDE